MTQSDLIQQVHHLKTRFNDGVDSPDNILWDLCMLFNGNQANLNANWQTFFKSALVLNADIEVHAPHQASVEQMTDLFQRMPA